MPESLRVPLLYTSLDDVTLVLKKNREELSVVWDHMNHNQFVQDTQDNHLFQLEQKWIALNARIGELEQVVACQGVEMLAHSDEFHHFIDQHWRPMVETIPPVPSEEELRASFHLLLLRSNLDQGKPLPAPPSSPHHLRAPTPPHLPTPPSKTSGPSQSVKGIRKGRVSKGQQCCPQDPKDWLCMRVKAAIQEAFQELGGQTTQSILTPLLGTAELGMVHDVLSCQNCWTGQEISYCSQNIYSKSHPLHVCPGLQCCCQ
jgi:hypothetical protein